MSTERDNLPCSSTSFIGRSQEQVELGRLLGEHRLITLIGPAGCGKSRLALEVARSLLESFRDGAWLVDLGTLSDPRLVLQAIATVLQVHEEPGQPLLETLSEAVVDRRLLLVLDNCEHLIDACAEGVQRLLRFSTTIRILATSREPLRIPEEIVYRLLPLAVPPPDTPARLSELTRIEAAHLFLDRAYARQPKVRLGDEDAIAVAEICRRLEGLPLAIELAAAQVGVLPISELARNLDTSLDVLRMGWRTLPHHSSLRATLDWSYNLLNVQEQRLFRRLAIFAGGFRLDAVQAVCRDESLGPAAVLGTLLSLADRSLVVPLPDQQAARYRLLEPIREYARERLWGEDEQATLAWAHLRYFTQWAEQVAAHLAGPEQYWAIGQLRGDEENIRAALERSTVHRDTAAWGLRLAVAMARFWMVRGQLAEGRQWIDRLLAAAPEDAPARTQALFWGAALALLQGDFAAVEDLAARCLARAVHDPMAAAECLAILAVAQANQGDPRARATAAESIARLRQLDATSALGRALMGAGIAARLGGDLQAAVDFHKESAQLLQEVGDWYFLAHTLSNQGLALLDLGEYARAEAVCERALALRRALANRPEIAWSLKDLGDIARAAGRLAMARARYVESLAILETMGDRARIEAIRRALAEIATTLGSGHSRNPRAPGGPTPADPASLLTAREREVARLLTRGYTNRQIAESLVITEGTAGVHVQHILTKLGFSSRAQIAAWAVAHGLAD
ncbi:MAG: hypothetical protein KatS3mg061_0152 [Dehalococcoidia bacterium]|nr:MAG: hypothetical protein KatS3mg061_0152 [Dehalococcoidia bacterium]